MILGLDGFASTPTCLRNAEQDLLGGTGGAAVAWLGRGATALCLAYRIIRQAAPDVSHPEVIMPAMCCATPANTACLAGLIPRFADIDPATGMTSLKNVKARWTRHTRAVLFVHLYGQTADLTDLAKWCKEHAIILVEDAAQSLGASLPNASPVGSIGDMTVYSFNPTKILECGGGALLLRAKELLNIFQDEINADHPPPELTPEFTAQLELSYRNLHHGLVALRRHRSEYRISNLFLGIRDAYDGLYMRSLKDPEALGREWERLPEILRQRRLIAATYSETLATGPWQLLDGWQNSGVCWRYSLLLNAPTQLVAFSDAVRRDGFHVSNLYWPLHDFFRPEDDCPKADTFARRIVNLWVDSTVCDESVRACAARFWEHAPADEMTNPISKGATRN